ncbi:MAG: hypothetical protein D6720_08610 [Gammaproteobacteria bacterium]|nr:MAG: hypothetical protein D6720_08610 [Gammaproteobacteria bacterium]
MRIPLILVALIALVLAGFWLFGPPPDPELIKPRTDLPWQVRVNADGSVHVFDLDIGRSTLRDAIAKFGEPEGAAVFQHGDGRLDLEVYFGKVHFGPLVARVVTKLEAPPQEKRKLAQSAKKRESSPTGDWKFRLPDDAIGHLLDHRLSAISYIPGTRSLDQAFYVERFGPPQVWLQEKAGARSLFYPARGLSILVDDAGPEVLEYTRPQNFHLPPQAQPWPPVPEAQAAAGQR